MNKITSRIFLLFLISYSFNVMAQELKNNLTPESFSMSRAKMYLEDTQVVLFNGIGSVNPRQYSITGLTNLKFYPIDLHRYDFHFNFLDNKSKEVVHDDTPANIGQKKNH